MVHTKVYGYCDAKCKVEVAPKEVVEQIDARIDSEIDARAEAISDVRSEIVGLQNDINEKITSRQLIQIENGQTLFAMIQDMNIGDELIFDEIKITPGVNETSNRVLRNGCLKKIDETKLGGKCSTTDIDPADTTQTLNGILERMSIEGSSLKVVYSTELDDEWCTGVYSFSFDATRVQQAIDCHMIKYGNSDGSSSGVINLNYETWTFTLDDGSTVTKEVCVR